MERASWFSSGKYRYPSHYYYVMNVLSSSATSYFWPTTGPTVEIYKDDPSSSSPPGLFPAPKQLEWTSFGGDHDDVSAFVQNVQRTALAHGRQDDETWSASYAASCFKDEALVWYNQLSDEVQISWRKLRPALLERFPIAPPAASEPPPPPSSAFVPAPASASGPPDIRSSYFLTADSTRGCIEVVDRASGQSVGFISRRGGCLIAKHPEESLIVMLQPTEGPGEPSRLLMVVCGWVYG